MATDVASTVRVAQERLFDVVQVAVEYLLGQGQALSAENATYLCVPVEEALVGRWKGAGGREASRRGVRRRCIESVPIYSSGTGASQGLL